MNKPSTVNIELNTQDKLLDLKLAIWETQLVEIYPNVCFSAEFDHVHQTAQVQIQFENIDDQLHWQLTWPLFCSRTNSWLTMSQFVVNCPYEKFKRNICQH